MDQLLRTHADAIVRASIHAVLPDEAVKRALDGQEFSGRVLLVSAGKAAWQMAKAAYDFWGERIENGVVVTKYDHVMGPIGNLELCEAGHPVPDENSFRGTQAALDLVASGVGIAVLSADSVQPRAGIAYVPVKNWHQALYMCILYDKWLEPPVWEFVEKLVKALRERE